MENQPMYEIGQRVYAVIEIDTLDKELKPCKKKFYLNVRINDIKGEFLVLYDNESGHEFAMHKNNVFEL